MVANGHHWDPKWPDFPGEFAGDTMHSHDYRTSDGLRGQERAGGGLRQLGRGHRLRHARVARQVFLSMRRGAHVLPKYLKGVPVDELVTPANSRLPFWFTRVMLMRLLKQAQGSMEDYGLPKPDHRLGEAHPTISYELLPAIGHGRVKPKPVVQSLEGHEVRFADGSVERDRHDRLLHGLPDQLPVPAAGGARAARTTSCRSTGWWCRRDLDGLYFIALLQPLGAMMPLAEAQSEWVADLLAGDSALPRATRCGRRSASGARPCAALRGVHAAHDPGGLLPLPARAGRRAQGRPPAHAARARHRAGPAGRAHPGIAAARTASSTRSLLGFWAESRL